MPAALQGSLVGRCYPEPLSSTKPLSPLALEIHANTKFSMAGVQVSEPCSRRAMGRDASTHEPTTSQGTPTNTKPTPTPAPAPRPAPRWMQGSITKQHEFELENGESLVVAVHPWLGSTEYLSSACKVLSSYHPVSSCQLVLSRLVSSRLVLSWANHNLPTASDEDLVDAPWLRQPVRDRCNATCRPDPAV